jgi:PBSX family phage terminase large subunit
MIKEIKLLNHQYEVLADTTTKIIGMVGGYGNGKTYTACRKAIQLSFLNAGYVGILTEPTYPMLRDILIPEMKNALEEWGIEYKFNASNSIFILNINEKETKLICMSMENVERLVGINAAFIICDEFDTTKADLAYKAFIKLLGRLRAGNVRQFIITTTPEGFRATYRIFIKEADDTKRLIRAKTTDNKYLPLDFIETLKKQYPPNLLNAYLDGEFVNLNSGTIYSYFNRETHHSIDEYINGETLYISQDFNYLGCISIVYVKRNGYDVAIDEIISNDTRSIIVNIKYKYPDSYICIYPDASGNAHKTSSSTTDIQMLREAGFSVFVNSRNPSVRDRINITNNLFEKKLIRVNTYKCPRFTESLEQHSYDEKTGEPCKYSGGATVDDFTDGGTYYLAYEYPIADSVNRVKLLGI